MIYSIRMTPYDMFLVSNEPSVDRLKTYVHWRTVDPFQEDRNVIFFKDKLAERSYHVGTYFQSILCVFVAAVQFFFNSMKLSEYTIFIV